MAIKGLPERGRDKSGLFVYSCDEVWAKGRTRAEAFANWQQAKKNQVLSRKTREAALPLPADADVRSS